MEISDPNSSVFIGGTRVSRVFVEAVCEALALENYDLYSSLRDIGGEMTKEDKITFIPYFREAIRQSLQSRNINSSISHTAQQQSSNQKVSSNSDTFNYSFLPPPPPPPTILNQKKTPSQAEYEAILRLADELDRRDREAAEEADRLVAAAVAELIAEEDEKDYQKRVSFYCEICRIDHLIDGAYTLECGHRFCEEVLSGYICSKINSNEVKEDVMICPIPGCGFSIHHTIIRGCTKDLNNEDAWNKYCEFQDDNLIAEELQKGSMFRCPTKNCNNAFEYSIRPNRSLPFQCGSCTQSYCINCKALQSGNQNSEQGARKFSFGPGHHPHTCEEQIQLLERDAETKRKFEEWKVLNEAAQRLFEEAMLQKGWKQCPSCGIYIERNEGCDHMTCRNCKCNFCYICGKFDKATPTNRGDCGSSCPNKKK